MQHTCADCQHEFTTEGQNQPHIQPAVQCPNCHSYRTQPSGIPDEANDMLHGTYDGAMPTSTQDDMSGNPLKEGLLADGGWKNRQVRDEAFASVRKGRLSLFEMPEFETTQIVAPPDLYRHGLESEATHKASIQIPKGITDNLHAALGNLGAWVENPYENGELRPYHNKYWKVIRPSYMKPGSLRIGVADPTMAEIINHVAQTDDLTPLYEYRGKESHTKTAGPLLALAPEAIAGLAGGAAEAAGAGAAAAGGAAEAAGAGAAGAGAADAAGTAGTGISNPMMNQMMLNQVAPQGQQQQQQQDDGQQVPMTPHDQSFYAREKSAGWLTSLIPGLGADAAEAGGVGGVMNSVMKGAPLLGMADDVLGVGSTGGGAGNQVPTTPHDQSFYARTSNDEDDAFPGVHGEIPKQEDGDYHQQDDGNNHEWQRDLSVNDGGGALHVPSFDAGGPAMMRFVMMLPLLKQYLDSGEDGSNDPLVKGLHDSLEAEIPGYRNHGDDEKAQHLIMILAQPQDGSAEPEKNEPDHTDENSGGGHASKVASIEGEAASFLPALEVVLPALTKTALGPPMPGAMPPGGPMGAGAPVGPPPPMGMPGTPPAAPGEDTSQGPVTDEQQAWFAQWLEEHGRADEIPKMIANPQLYAKDFAKARGKEVPPQTPDAGLSGNPPEPAQEEAPPGDTMPVPGMEQQMLSAVRRYAADNIADKCPECGSHTTELLDNDGKSRCHGCGHIFTTSGEADTVHPGQSTASTWNVDEDLRKEAEADMDAGSDSFDAAPVHGVPIADQSEQRDLREEQDSGHTWTDEYGVPLRKGQEYEMYSEKYDIPDLVRIEAIKPNSIVYTLTGEFGLEHSTELTKEEANIERTTFVPTDQVEGESDHGLEDNDDNNTPYTGEPERNDASAPTGLVAASVIDSGVEHANPKLAWLQEGLPRTSGANYTPMEQRALIEESGMARNADLLDLANTHYNIQDADEDQFLFGY